MRSIQERTRSWTRLAVAGRRPWITGGRVATLLVAVLAFGVPAPAGAQTTPASPRATSPGDARWSAWLGCWQPVESRSGIGGNRAAGTPGGIRLCVTREDDSVVLTTWSGKSEVLRQRIVADGARHDLEEPGCRGWQRDEWAASGQGIYSQAEIACGNEPARKIAGLGWNDSQTWLDVQTIETGGRQNIRIRRYRRIDDEDAAAATKRTAASSMPVQFTLEDVEEASGKVPSAVLEAALVETGTRFAVRRRELRQLDAANVPSRVIDLLVALSYPKQFVIERTAPVRVASWGGGGGGSWWPIDAGFGASWWLDPFYMSRLWSMHYSPYGYSYWGYWDPYYYPYYPNGGFIVVVPPDGETTAAPHGRVVADAGYTRVYPRPPAGAIGGGPGSWGSSPSGTGGSTGGSGGGASPGGYSSGGGGDTGRTAQPRNP